MDVNVATIEEWIGYIYRRGDFTNKNVQNAWVNAGS
jgi:hypothetical protein